MIMNQFVTISAFVRRCHTNPWSRPITAPYETTDSTCQSQCETPPARQRMPSPSGW